MWINESIRICGGKAIKTNVKSFLFEILCNTVKKVFLKHLESVLTQSPVVFRGSDIHDKAFVVVQKHVMTLASHWGDNYTHSGCKG